MNWHLKECLDIILDSIDELQKQRLHFLLTYLWLHPHPAYSAELDKEGL